MHLYIFIDNNLIYLRKLAKLINFRYNKETMIVWYNSIVLSDKQLYL